MFIKLLLESLVVFLGIDAVWISQIASPWMKKSLPNIISANPNFIAALLFYILYLLILLVLFIIPGISNKVSYQTLAIQSFLFGIAAYATYDLTNLTIIKGYPWTMALADIIWGGILTMVTALIIYKLNV